MFEGTDRLEIFSDGVIAIAITLLVLDIRVPSAKDGALFHDLASNWPSYVAYVLSFAVIGIIWVAHHSMFENISSVDRGLLFTNLALLLGVAFVPFPTSLLAEYVHVGGSNAHAAAAVYSATMTFIGLAFTAIWLHLARHPELLGGHADAANLRRSIRRSLVSPVVYGLSIGLAFVERARLPRGVRAHRRLPRRGPVVACARRQAARRDARRRDRRTAAAPHAGR